MEKNRSAEELTEKEDRSISENIPETAKKADAEADEQKKPPKGSKEEAYEWLIQHHVTARVMDIVIAVCIVLLIIVVVLGMR